MIAGRGVVPPAVTASEAVVQQSKSKRAMKRKAQDQVVHCSYVGNEILFYNNSDLLQHLGAFYSYEVKDSKLKRK